MKAYVEKVIFSWWWVVLFILLCYMSYEQGIRSRNMDFAKLSIQLTELQEQQKVALAFQEDLRLQINSQSDPDWIELTLMKGLGLVPEGQVKVYFKGSDIPQISNNPVPTL